ncbi:MAG: alpha/beta fold hydrolase [Phreatobacter sp.]|uniref:alpha/beta fold hydrolase n=1 Tax=Phreatobacter sp. TaxID=1966341 RepID=UPI00273528C8|nr:alpha/beta fold hydrolase [Phreatobacter sp.]MDP2802283.1 alpha/beta fold hydrolase [Phreatobacter sp.]
MIPITFNGLMGKLHLPDEGRRSGVGVVIVPPHGVEALAATKTLRRMAEALAEAGHAALRFDLPGTADSLGVDTDPDRIAAWVAATGDAATVLARHASVGGVVYAGLRFGATIAAMAAGDRSGLAGLILLDPVVKGRLYARELAMTARALAEASRLDPDETATEAGLSIAGLTTSVETLESMRGIDLQRLAVPAAPVLLLSRKSSADARLLAGAWAAGDVTAAEVRGFEAISLSPTTAATPADVLADTVAWVNGLAGKVADALPPPALALLAGPHFTEEALVFGEELGLFGVLCEPETAAPGRPVLLIVNAGRNSHVGWARSGVQLARELADQGIASLRMDLAGIGDAGDRAGSPDSLDSVLYNKANEPQVSVAIDLLVGRGYGNVTLLGACSGAYLALQQATRDERIGGLIIVNIQRFVWRPGETVEEAIASAYPLAASYAAKVFEARAWRRLLTGERKVGPLIHAFGKRATDRLRALRPSDGTRQARAIMRRLSERRVSVDIIFSENDAGLSDLALHFGSGGRWLAGQDNVQLTILPQADHDLTPPAARDILIARAAAIAKRSKTPS